jgi:K+-transporting ATPase KdpF subunit
MVFDYLAGGLTVAFITAYLLYALLNPERF